MMSGCAGPKSSVKPALLLSEADIRICRELNIQGHVLAEMKAKPIYGFSEKEIDLYLKYLRRTEPELRKRVQHIARKNLNQPYRIFLLGEYPFELFDADPLYSLKESDCVVFSEHTYAMALAHDWPSFFVLLQRLRYKNGEIGMLSRNHYTVADWDRNNSWLLEDITAELAGERAVPVTMVINRARFFSKYDIGQEILPETVAWSYIPYKLLPEIIDHLQPGDFVNIVRGNDNSKYVGHVGLISRSDDGTVNFLHSTYPRVREQPLMELHDTAEQYNENRRRQNIKIREENAAARIHNRKIESTGSGEKKKIKSLKPYFYGFKFLRLREDPLEELKKIDGLDGPRIIIRADIK